MLFYTGVKMVGRGVIFKSTAIAILLLFLFASAVNAGNRIGSDNIISSTPNENNFNNQRGMWEDDFLDESKIDTNPPGSGSSDNYVVSDSKVSMINTYQAWIDPAWTKLRVIDITNNAGQTLEDFALKLTIDYDSDMNSDFSDIRFKHEDNPGLYLDYWIESFNSNQAFVWIKFSSLPTDTSEVYLFYGNPSAQDESDFGSVFSDWDEKWSDDYKITDHLNNEGTWDPDVSYGNNYFIVFWEEGQAYYPPYTFGFKQEIRASIFNTSGNKEVDDALVFKDNTLFYRNENPSADYGGGKWFVAWEHYNTVANPSADTLDIKGRMVSKSGSGLSLGSVINICAQTNVQADAHVEFDSINNRLCVIWEDARLGTSNYNLYAKLYDTNGNQVGSEKTISSASDSQCEPWVAFDPINERYLIVWEEGETPDNGPFDIWAGLFDEDLSIIGSAQKLADGDDYTDYNFPCVYFNEETEEYLVTWNDGDISSGDWRGNIWGTIIDSDGNVVINNFQISSGDYVRTDIVTYPLSDMEDPYFVTYDDNTDIWGKIVTSDGEPSSSSEKLSVNSDTDHKGDWANIDIGNSKIFVAWEDLVEDYPSQYDDVYPDIYCNLWDLQTNTGSSVIYSIGNEIEQALSAHVTSIEINKGGSSFWNEFDAVASNSDLTFDILDGASGVVLVSNIEPGDSIQDVTASSIRLMASFSRSTPSYSPEIDYWNVSWIGNNPPNPPSDPDPEDGATDIDVNVVLSWTCSDPDGDPLTYDVYFDTVDPPVNIVSSGQSGTSFTPGTLLFETTYYWKIKAYDAYSSTSGSVWSFTTYTNDPPYEPSNPNPPNGATQVDLEADISWTGGDPNGDSVTYDIYFGTVTPPPLIEWDYEDTTWDPGTLTLDTDYFWKILSEDEHGSTNEGPIWTFKTGENDPPYEPSNPNPPDGASDIELDITLSWTGGDPNSGDPVRYDLYLGINSPPAIWKRDITETLYYIEDLDPGTLYYWKIVAKDSYGAETEGPVWQFTTIGSDYPPSKPAIAGPRMVVPGEVCNYKFVSTDVDGDDLFYLIDWGDGTVEEWIGPYPEGEVITIQHTYSGRNKPLIIRAKAKDEFNQVGPEAVYPIFISRNREINRGHVKINILKSQSKSSLIKSAILILRNENGRIVRIGFTDRLGQHSFRNLPNDESFTIRIIRPGYIPKTVDIRLTYENPIIYETIELEYVGAFWIKHILPLFF